MKLKPYIFAIFLITLFTLGANSAKAVSSTDNFDRANGALGSNWASFSEAGLLISANKVIGNSLTYSGSYRTGETYNTNQYSEVEIGTVVNTQTIAVTVRSQNQGQDLYAGIYAYQNGTPVLRIMKRVSGTYTQLGADVSVSPLSLGTKLKIMVVGNTIALLQDGVEKLAVFDTSSQLSGGSPGIQVYGTPTLDNWAGGDQSFQFNYLGVDANGVKSYNMISQYNGYGPHILRVLEPTNPALGKVHNFMYQLGVEPESTSDFGDGLEELRLLNAHNEYNVTIISPAFKIFPWFADSDSDNGYLYESFMLQELRPWVLDNLAISGNEQHWLIGYSKSGIAGVDLIFRNPSSFALAAGWDYPIDLSWCFPMDYHQCLTAYGTIQNYDNNYKLYDVFFEPRKAPFLNHKRIWISGSSYGSGPSTDALSALWDSMGILHVRTENQPMAHLWNAGWLTTAVSTLYQMSLPLITSFSVSESSTPLTINITALTATDSVSVTGYKLTESATPPNINDSGWSASAPTTHTFTSGGIKTLYAWAKNLAGAVSLSQTVEVNVLGAPSTTSGGGGGGGGFCIRCSATITSSNTNNTIQSSNQNQTQNPFQTSTTQSPSTSSQSFTKTLKLGQINSDVKRLQEFLNKDPDTRITQTGLGSPGKETNKFGLLTRKAVIRFQEKYAKDILTPAGLIKGTGFVGKATLKKINEILGKDNKRLFGI